MTGDLFAGVDPALVAAIEARYAEETAAQGQARAHRRHARHQVRRAKAAAQLAEILPARFPPGESWHVVSHGDIDALSYLEHAIQATFFDFVLLSTWCMATEDLQQIRGWLDAGRIDHLTLCAGEIFPSQYGDEYQVALKLEEDYAARVVIARNHSKVILCANFAEDYYLAMESSANINTNPRIEQTAIHADRGLFEFYRDFYDGLRSIDRRAAS